jgi:hypothetical protein
MPEITNSLDIPLVISSSSSSPPLESIQRHRKKKTSEENVFLMAYHYSKLFRFPIWD